MTFRYLNASQSHSTSAGFAVSYLGGAVRQVTEAPGGVVFEAGFGRRRVTYLCADPRLYDDKIAAARLLSPVEVSCGWPKTVRKEYVLRTLDVSHLTAKERYNECTHPVKSLEKRGYAFEFLRKEHLPGVTELWGAWCEKKLDDPKTHRISFTAARYLRCVTDVLDGQYINRSFVLVNATGRVAACRVLSVNQDLTHAFDLAFFTDRMIGEASRALQWQSLKYLFDIGVKEVNFGESTGKGLTHFKTRFKTELLKSYQYDLPKQEPTCSEQTLF